MHVSVAPPPSGEIEYPESDGQPMADNSRQFRWIFVLAGNIAALFRDREDVFVCGNQNWYPVEREPEIVCAPDVYAVFGRPKGDRPSWKQWQEDGVPLTVVFEVLSPKNTHEEMADKLAFYDEYGVEEYYLYDPDTNWLAGYNRRGEALRRVRPMDGFVSPRLGIHFDLSGKELLVRYPDGRPFLTFEELAADRDQAYHAAEEQRQRADQAQRQVEEERQRAQEARQEAGQARQRADRLAELSGKILRQEATPEDVEELQRLLK